MTDNVENVTTEVQASEATGFTPITSQEQLNSVLADRLRRERAKYVDYADLKEKAGTVEELTARAEAAEAKIAELTHANEIRSWRDAIATEYGVPADALRGETKEALEEHATQLQSLLATKPAAPRTVIRTEGEPSSVALNGDPLVEGLKTALGIN
jgi:hypothetical protein